MRAGKHAIVQILEATRDFPATVQQLSNWWTESKLSFMKLVHYRYTVVSEKDYVEGMSPCLVEILDAMSI